MNALVGHEGRLELLERSAGEGRPAHGYLFTGPEGVGKKLAAIHFACRLNCPDPEQDRTDSCRVCRRIREGRHPDVLIERPEKNVIRIERVREVQGFFKYAPVEGRHRVAIIDDAHCMNRYAQNALLKTLEEPPSARLLILVTSKPFLLLSTVRSRCRRMRFAPLETDQVEQILHDVMGMPGERAAIAASLAGGSVSRAVEMDSKKFMGLREKVLSALAEPEKLGVGGIMELSAEIAADRRTAQDAVTIASTWVRDLLMIRAEVDCATIMHGDFLDRFPEAALHHSGRELLAVYQVLSEASEMIDAETNLNTNLVTDVTLLKVIRMLVGPTYGLGTSVGRN